MGRLSAINSREANHANNECPYCGAKLAGIIYYNGFAPFQGLMHRPSRCEKNPAVIREKEIEALPEHLKHYVR